MKVLRRLDEGIVPTAAFPPDYQEENDAPEVNQPDTSFTELESLRVPAFLSFMSSESLGKRKFAIAGAVAFAVVASVAAIGVPAGWYSRAKASAVASQPTTAATAMDPASPVAEVPKSDVGDLRDFSSQATMATRLRLQRSDSVRGKKLKRVKRRRQH